MKYAKNITFVIYVGMTIHIFVFIVTNIIVLFVILNENHAASVIGNNHIKSCLFNLIRIFSVIFNILVI